MISGFLRIQPQGSQISDRSYGPQNKTGYQIKVDAVLEGEKTVRIQTSLLGPEKGEKTKDVVTYPYVVVKLKKTEKEKIKH